MKVIFLDIDGVMNHENHMVRSRFHFSYEFCPIAVQNLREVIKRTGAKIVISSTWRHGGVDEMREVLSYYDLDAYLVGITPYFPDDIRGNEILDYVRRHDKEIESFVILDDDDDMGTLKRYLVRCFEPRGFTTDELRERVIEMLNGPEKGDTNDA